MKANNVKSFTFKVADKADKKQQWKAREGVAVAGCTLVSVPWGGKEPTTNFNGGDGGLWC